MSEDRTDDDRLVTVCEACKMACCWHGVFLCEDYRTAGTIQLSISELRRLTLEHPQYWEKENCMKGAAEYAELFSRQEQHGRLLLVPGEHARGKTFQIYVLADDKKETRMFCKPPGAVEVYGVVSGHPGWTESYGWKHRGPWEDDFLALVEQRRAEKKAAEIEAERKRTAAEDAKLARTESLLSTYKKG